MNDTVITRTFHTIPVGCPMTMRANPLGEVEIVVGYDDGNSLTLIVTDKDVCADLETTAHAAGDMLPSDPANATPLLIATDKDDQPAPPKDAS
ncbi:hypothetical protein [Actinocrispum wychmicini]|uniref:Uncharacterized protein n=1 Tax=Actinocrispum wychmicini TaxID=1213861 RepID=A0A4R2IUM8_9PSEU|nr:hypothetical protein [Actinocrispum wychmicini]TCO47999.1 hypothetical protein EV192_11652 [Actinocrispum wychmicini]